MKFIYYQILKIKYNLINTFYFFLFGVKKNENLRINGILFLRAKGNLKFGKNVVINSSFKFNPIGGQTFMSIVVNNNAILKIEDGVAMSNSSIYCVNNIFIGKKVFIGGDCKIYDTDFHSIHLKERIKEPQSGIKTKPVYISDGVFIGTGSIILKGVNIGCNSVIAAGSVVSKNIPPNEVWGGNPIKFIKKI
ncbi:acyltransferase [uncultured Maribacter sp.]|uniref:acyltransferase n=1 Tax=uncultured Maribacter sp. TaxID=431308 RepID=UPI0026074F84|nr:acyltransferase [uncultured Maribacter sp.]